MRKEEAVANYFILLGTSETEDYMTNLRLQKLMYFADGWNMILRGKPMFEERPVAIDYGPIIPSVYREYKAYGKNPIRETDPSFSIEMIPEDDLEVLSAVAAKYLQYSTGGLVDLTHKPGGAWRKTPYTCTMKDEDIYAEFSAMPRLKLAGDRPVKVLDACPASWMDE